MGCNNNPIKYFFSNRSYRKYAYLKISCRSISYHLMILKKLGVFNDSNLIFTLDINKILHFIKNFFTLIVDLCFITFRTDIYSLNIRRLNRSDSAKCKLQLFK